MQLSYSHNFSHYPGDFYIYHEGERYYHIKTSLSWGHEVLIKDLNDEVIAQSQDQLLTLLPSFKMIIGENTVGRVKRVVTLGATRYDFNYRGWMIQGLLTDDHFGLIDERGRLVATYEKVNGRHIINVKNKRFVLEIVLCILSIQSCLALE